MRSQLSTAVILGVGRATLARPERSVIAKRVDDSFRPFAGARGIEMRPFGSWGGRSEKPQAPSDDCAVQFIPSPPTIRERRKAPLFRPTIRARIPGYGLV